MPDNQPDFPEVIDSSLMSAWRSCQRKAFLEYFEHWKSKTPNVHLHAGASFAKGLEVAREQFYALGADPQTALVRGMEALLAHYGAFECPEDSAKSATRMAGALEYYFHRWPLGEDKAGPLRLPSGKYAIEFSFLEPLDIQHPVTGQPLLYAGRFDQIVDYAGGVYGEDDKTTSSLGASWPFQWNLRPQFTSYTWAARRHGLDLRGFLVRGVSILKTKYDAAETITPRPQWMIDEWYENLMDEVAEMKRAWESGRWRKDLDSACNEYGGCQFRNICLSDSPAAWLPVNFERRRWDPVTRTETKLEEV